MGQFAFGQSVKRTEDLGVLTGTAVYSGDIFPADAGHAVVVRSPFAHALLSSIDTTEAAEMPGVRAILTHKTVEAAGIGGIPNMCEHKMMEGYPYIRPHRPVLATGRVRYVGEPIAFVIADTLENALAAADAVMVDYDPLDTVASIAEAAPDGVQGGAQDFLPPAAPPAVRVWGGENAEAEIDAADNIAFRWSAGDQAVVESAFATAKHCYSLTLDNNRVIVNPMENRSALAEYDPQTEKYTLTTPSQGVHSLRNQIADRVLGIDRAQLHVKTPRVGGGFGIRIFLYNEQVLALLGAKLTGAPVKWQGTRSEGFISDYAGRSHRTTVAVALDATHQITAIRVLLRAEMGAYLSNQGAHIPTECSGRMLSGLYVFPKQYIEVHGVFTHTTPLDAYRGAGRPEMSYMLERMFDGLAAHLGIDRIALRMQHYIPTEAMPYRTPLGLVYDSGGFADLAQRAMRNADWESFDARRTEAEQRGKLRGIGLASYIETPGPGGREATDLRLTPDGKIELRTGTLDNGQGQITSLQQIVAIELGIDMADVTVVTGDSELIATGSGTGGSRFLAVCGSATRGAALRLIDVGRKLAAEQFEADAADLSFEDGAYSVAGTDLVVSLGELAAQTAEGSISAAFNNDPAEITCPNGVHVCEVEIDPETGVIELVRYTVVDDFGKIMNPMIVRGQVHGGIAQGIGQALYEHVVFDAESGQLLSGSFMDYAMPRADNFCPIAIEFVEDYPCTTNPLGVKGAGEAGAIGACPAVVNAVLHALQPYGVTHLDMPLLPQKIWRALQLGKAA